MTDSPDIRISDSERESALKALGEHMSSGRLSVDEYGDRSAGVAVARTRRELIALFTDLPEPRPLFGSATALEKPSHDEEDDEPAPAGKLARTERHPVVQRVATTAVLAIVVGAVGLFLITGAWLLLVVAIGLAVAGGLVLIARHAKGAWKQDSEFDAEFDAAFDETFNTRYDPRKARSNRKDAKEYSKNYTRNYMRNYMRKYNERGH